MQQGGRVVAHPAPPGPDEPTSSRRFDDLVAAEQTLVPVRWGAIPFGIYLIVSYGLPAPGWVRPVGFALMAFLAVATAVATVAVRRVRTARAAASLAATTLLVDTLVMAGFVWMYTFDASSAHFLLFFVLPAEAALKFRLGGALGMWAGVTMFYTVRQLWAVEAYGIPSSTSSIVFRMGILLIVSAILGLFAQRLSRRTEELCETLDELQREEEWRTALINMLAHDFRAPVSTAISTITTVDRQLDALEPADVRRLLGVATRQSRRGLALADDLLTLARARQDHLELRREEMPVEPALRRAVARLGEDDGWAVVDVPDDLHAVVDPARFEQVASNLLSNARKHGRPPVAVSARPLDAGGVELQVSDAGDGVSPEYQDGLFTQFSSGPRKDSVGLGLWLVDVLAAAHGGRATYETVRGRPTFTVTLPGPSEHPTPAGAR